MAIIIVLPPKNQPILLHLNMHLHRLVFHEKERHRTKELPNISPRRIDLSHQADRNLRQTPKHRLEPI